MHPALIQTDPYLTPALLLVAGLVAAWLAVLRGRQTGRLRLWLRAGYAIIAGAAFLAAGIIGVHRAQLFHDLHWEEGGEVLVLHRPLPLGEVRHFGRRSALYIR